MKRIVGLMTALLLLSSCAPKSDNSTKVTSRAGGNPARERTIDRRENTSTSTVAGVPLNGAVFTQSTYQDSFNELVRDLMEMVIDREAVGYVASEPDGQTGLYVGAKVTLEGNAKVRNGYASAYASTNSRLVIAVYDRFAEANLAPLPAMEFKLISGYVNGSQAVLEFQQVSSEGPVRNYVRLEGNINSQWFVARMYFDTQSMWDGSGEGHTGYFEYFNAKTCDVFACN
jgi:hypothetical protein